MTLIDRDGKPLEEGYYFARGGIGGTGDIYKVKVSENTFTAESWEGFMPIVDFQQASRHFSRIDDIFTNMKFIMGKLGIEFLEE